MAFNVQFIIKARDSMSGAVGKAADQLDRASRAADKLNGKLKGADNGFKRLGGTIAGIGADLTMKVSAPLALAGGFAIKAAADLETMGVGFEVMLGSAEKAKKLTEDLVKFSAATPFEMPGIQAAAKSMLAAGVTAEEMTAKIKMVGDVASGSGVPIEEMASIMSKIKMKGKAMTEELLQLSERGVPIVDVLGKKFGKTGEQIFEAASKGQISADVIEKAFAQMSGPGGKFFNMMQKQSETTAGRFSTLSDSVRMAAAEFGTVLIQELDLGGAMEGLSNALSGLQGWFKGLSPTSKKLIAILAVSLVVIPPIIAAVGALVIGIGMLSAPIVLVALKIGLIIGAVIAVVAAVWAFKDEIAAAFNSVVQIYADGLAGIGLMLSDAWAGFTAIITGAWGGIVGMMKSAWGGISGFIGGVVDEVVGRVMSLIASVQHGAAAIAALASGDFSGAAEAAKQAATATVHALTGISLAGSADVNVNVNAPRGAVGSVRGGSTGGVNLNLGVNPV